MGGGASVEIRHTHASFMHVTDAHFQELLSSKAAREHLFQDIAKYPVDGKADRHLTVSLPKLAAYFNDNTNSLYPGFHVNVDTLSAAFKYTVQKFKERQSQKKNKSLSKKMKAKIQTDPQLTKAMVHSFLPTLLLFCRVWDVFDAADKLVVEDQKVFKGEFMKIKEKLNNVHGIVIFGEISDEDWEKEFNTLDKNNDRFITFEEMCSYALDHIKRPFDYDPSEEDALLEDNHEDDENEDEPAEPTEPTLLEVVSLGHKKSGASGDAAPAGPAIEPEAAHASPRAGDPELADPEPQAAATTEEGAAQVVEAVAESDQPPSGPTMFV